MTLQTGDKRTICNFYKKNFRLFFFLTMMCLNIDAPVEGYTLFVLWITLSMR